MAARSNNGGPKAPSLRSDPPAPRHDQPANLADVVRGFTAADWKETGTLLALIAIAIASAAVLILLLEPALP